VDAHFKDLEARLAPAGAELVGMYADGMCGTADADALQATFAPRMVDIEGGPRELQQTVESIHLCAAQQQARAGLPLDFPKR
jgi:alanyl aminopeptidase